jgi:hypothetical protein
METNTIQVYLHSSQIPCILIQFLKEYINICLDFKNRPTICELIEEAAGLDKKDRYFENIFDLENNDILKNSSEKIEKFLTKERKTQNVFYSDSTICDLQGIFYFLWFVKSEIYTINTTTIMLDGYVKTPLIIGDHLLVRRALRQPIANYIIRYLMLITPLHSPASLKSKLESLLDDRILPIEKVRLAIKYFNGRKRVNIQHSGLPNFMSIMY